jgi:hypothetical protein
MLALCVLFARIHNPRRVGYQVRGLQSRRTRPHDAILGFALRVFWNATPKCHARRRYFARRGLLFLIWVVRNSSDDSTRICHMTLRFIDLSILISYFIVHIESPD